MCAKYWTASRIVTQLLPIYHAMGELEKTFILSARFRYTYFALSWGVMIAVRQV